MPDTVSQKILIADDDSSFLDSSASLLRKFGYSVVRAESAEETLAVLDRDEPRAVLIDIYLDGEGGIALCRRIRESRAGRDVPIILLSSQSDVENRLEGLAAGADDFLERPFQPQELRLRVELHLRERAQRRSLKRANERLEAINEVGMLLSSNLLAEDPYDLAAAAIAGEFKLEMAAIGIVGARGLELSAVAPETEAAMGKELIARAGAARAMETALLQFEVEPTGERLCWAPVRDRQGTLGVLAIASGRPDAFSDEDARALSTVCGQLALAFRKHEFIGRIRAYSERLETTVMERTETLERQIRFTGQIIDSLPISLYVVDRARMIVAWNRQREQGNQGLLREKALGRSLFDVFDQQQREDIESELRPVFDRGESLVFERDSTADGELRHFRIRKVPMRLEPGEVTHVLTIGKDITDQRRLQKSMVVTEKMAAMGRLASGVAHEINNPLATIVTCADGLRNRLRELPEGTVSSEFREYVDIVEQEAYRAKRITEDLLDFSRVRPSARRMQSVERILDRTLLILKHHAGFKRIEVERQFEANLPPIAVEEDAIVQVFVALIINALDAMPEGGRLTLSTRSSRDDVHCEVRDTGGGIDPTDLPRIFEPFFTTKPPGRGTGLGLAVCYGIMQSHGGRIEVDSVPGRGSRFTVVLPIGRATTTRNEEGPIECSRPTPSGS